ncbi:hypothetical protein ACFL35_00225 [Candidatus Riflebacteria bacterium]
MKKKLHGSYRKLSFNLIEVMLAMAIMALALIPIFGIITKDVKDQDVAASYGQAMEYGSSTLDYFLETVPFEAILSRTWPQPCTVEAIGTRPKPTGGYYSARELQSNVRGEAGHCDKKARLIDSKLENGGCGKNSGTQKGGTRCIEGGACYKKSMVYPKCDKNYIKKVMDPLIKRTWYNESHQKKTIPYKAAVGNKYIAVYRISDFRGITYQVTIFSKDFEHPAKSPNKFNGGSAIDCASWKELYFDFYQLPEFELQKNWGNLFDKPTFEYKYKQFVGITPYEMTGKNAKDQDGQNLRGFGEYQRDTRGGPLKFGSDYPGHQGTAEEAGMTWNKNVCLLKKILVEVRWNMAQAYYHKPLDEKSPGSRPTRMYFTSFKGDLYR